jgi:hypothetical protein
MGVCAGYVTHATDRPLWAFRLPVLEEDQVKIAREWLESVDRETKAAEKKDKPSGGDPRDVLMLRKDKTIGWEKDSLWDEMMRLGNALGVLGEGAT